jgi:hypothetical protein
LLAAAKKHFRPANKTSPNTKKPMSYAPVQPASPGDDAELDHALAHALSEFGSDELGRLSSSVEVQKRAKPHCSTSTDATREALALDSDAVVSTFYPEQVWIGALLSTSDGSSSALCIATQALCMGLGVFSLLT